MKRTFSRRDFLRVAGGSLTAVAVLGAAGCAGGQQGNGGQGDVEGEISFWHYYGEPFTAPLEDLLRRYEEANPGVTVNPRLIPFEDFNRTLLQSGAGGDLPDIALVNAFDVQSLAEAGVLQDITDRARGSKLDSDDYFESSWDTTLYQGKNYGLPHVVDCYVLWYNKDAFEEAGVEPPGTWDELGTVASELSGGDRYGIAMSGVEGVEGSTAWIIRFVAAGGDITQVDSAAGREAMLQWVDLVESGAMSREFLGWIEDDVYARFANGQAVMMVNSSSYVNVIRDEYPDLNWAVALLPEAQQRATFLSSEDLTITTGSQNPDIAFDLMTYMQQPKVLNEYLPERNKLPAVKEVANGEPWSTDPVWSVFMEQLPTAWVPDQEIAPKSAEIFTYVQEAIQAAVGGDSSVEAALSRAQERISGALQE
jgi:multiple sugar transport system substrate-binding protein